MTSEQKIMIEEYRKNGIGYKQIAKGHWYLSKQRENLL